MLSSLPIERVGLMPGPYAKKKQKVTNGLVSGVVVVALLSFLALMAWRELVREFDSSICDFAASFETHQQVVWR